MKPEADFSEDIQNITTIRKKVLCVVGIVLLVMIGMYVHAKPKTSVNKVDDDTYTTNIASNGANQESPLPFIDHSVEEKQPIPEVSPEHIAVIREKQNELQRRLSAPLMLMQGEAPSTESQVAPDKSKLSDDPNIQFKNQVASQAVEVASAGSIGDLGAIIATGSLIHATLESATNSDLPGYLRASVSQSVYSEDGSQVLIPRGSRLIGQYKSGMLQGQSRIFIVWTRVLTPQGVAVDLGSSGVDSLGVAGQGADEINRHFWHRFGMASLLSVIGVGAGNTGGSGVDNQGPASLYREAVASSFSQSAHQSLKQEGSVAPTLITYQGKPIIVFVAKDLHFATAMQQVKPTINIF